MKICLCFIIMSLAVIEAFSTEIINSTAVRAMWFEVEKLYLYHYTLYYYLSPVQNGGRKRQIDEEMANFSAGMCSGVIGGLEEAQRYLFSLAVTVLMNDQRFEGQRTEPAPPG